jgi:hypothetical protein
MELNNSLFLFLSLSLSLARALVKEGDERMNGSDDKKMMMI